MAVSRRYRTIKIVQMLIFGDIESPNIRRREQAPALQQLFVKLKFDKRSPHISQQVQNGHPRTGVPTNTYVLPTEGEGAENLLGDLLIFTQVSCLSQPFSQLFCAFEILQ